MEIKQHTFKQPMDQRRNHKGIWKYLETNENKTTTYWNLWDAEKAVLSRKFIVINTYIKKQERSEINNLTLKLKELDKEQKPQKLAEGRK